MGRGGGNMRYRQNPNDYMVPPKRRDPLLEEIDQWGKLDGSFNNIDHFPTPLPQDPLDDWDYFGHDGPSQISQQNNYYYTPQQESGGYGGGGGGERDGEGGPYGIQVVDVLHRKQTNNNNRKRPQHKWRFKTKAQNFTTEEPHLIEKLWEDYNSGETRSVIPYWRRRGAYRNFGEDFLGQPRRKGEFEFDYEDKTDSKTADTENAGRKETLPGN